MGDNGVFGQRLLGDMVDERFAVSEQIARAKQKFTGRIAPQPFLMGAGRQQV